MHSKPIITYSHYRLHSSYVSSQLLTSEIYVIAATNRMFLCIFYLTISQNSPFYTNICMLAFRCKATTDMIWNSQSTLQKLYNK